jgi:hypothetical protein
MKHEKIVMASDSVSGSFVRSLIICMAVGATIWSGLLYLIF